MGEGLARLCRSCGHAEAHHGPISGRRRDDGAVIPGRLCFFSENSGYQRNLCPCSGFNSVPDMSYMEVVNAKLCKRQNHYD